MARADCTDTLTQQSLIYTNGTENALPVGGEWRPKLIPDFLHNHMPMDAVTFCSCLVTTMHMFGAQSGVASPTGGLSVCMMLNCFDKKQTLTHCCLIEKSVM